MMPKNTNDHAYNLMTQLNQENKSLWRIERDYAVNDNNCEKCNVLWDKMKKEKAENIETLESLVKAHL